MNIRSKNLTSAAMFLAMAVLLPMLAHAVGLGAAFLPMFWPVAAAIFFLPLSHVVLVAFLAPLVSSLLTGMPPVSPPILQVMMVELVVMVVVGSLMYRRLKMGVLWALILGLLASRAVLFVMVGWLATLLGLPETLASVAWVIRGVPGLLIMLVLIPILVMRINDVPMTEITRLQRV